MVVSGLSTDIALFAQTMCSFGRTTHKRREQAVCWVNQFSTKLNWYFVKLAGKCLELNSAAENIVLNK